MKRKEKILMQKLNEAIENNNEVEVEKIINSIKSVRAGDLSGYASIDNPQNIGASFFKKNPIIPNTNIFNAIKMLSLLYRNREAVDCLDIKANYQKLIDDAVTISLAFKELGIKNNDIVAISMDNFYQVVASFIACNRIGATLTILNSFAPKEEVYNYLNEFESPIFINYNKTAKENMDIKNNTNVKHIITLAKSNVNSLNLNNNYKITSNDNYIDFNSLGSIAKFQKNKFERYHGSSENALILFTSGTTGKPKSVVLTNKNILASGTYLKNSSNVNNSDRKTLVCVPFTYPYGFATSTLMSLLSGKTAILAPGMSKDTISYYLSKNPNIIFGSPALLELIMKNTDSKQDLSSITQFISGGDFLTPSANKRGKDFFKAHGADVELGNGSGNAETVSCGTNPVGIKNRPETAGKILTGTDVMIVDPETMIEKKYNEEGLLCVSGDHVFKEYYGRPDLTESSKFEKNGKIYFKTGTMGYIDKEGYFTLTGRESRFYIMSSLNKVYMDHIQKIISEFSYVKDCAIVKVPDEDKLFVNKAYVVLNDCFDQKEALSKFMNSCKSSISKENGEVIQLKDYEIPTYVEFVESLPRKSGTEKIDYALLEQDALSKLKEKIKVLKK